MTSKKELLQDEKNKATLESIKNSIDNALKLSVNDGVNIVSKGDIKTAKRSKEDYDLIWKSFLEREKEFKDYMGYGKKAIKKIGIKKFIDFVDWRTPEDISRFKTDKLKVIPCQNCKQELTIFQNDFGLCDKCKADFEFDKFVELCNVQETHEPGSSIELISMFTYDPNIRNMFKKNRSLRDKAEDCIFLDGLAGFFTLDTLLNVEDIDTIVNNINKLIETYSSKDYGITFSELTMNKLKSLNQIYKDTKGKREEFNERIKRIFTR